MNIATISFCDRVGFNVNSDDAKRVILGNLEKDYNLKIISKHYERWDEARSIPILQKNPHLICLRSNGNPYYFHLIKHDFIQYCIFIDKKVQHGYFYPRMIIGRFSFDDSLFENGGTLLEGEMIKPSQPGIKPWHFVINDLLVYQGKHLHEANLPKRLNILYNMLHTKFTPDDTDVCRFFVKKYFNYENYQDISEHVNKLPYTSRGLIFKPLYLRFKDILYNFDDTLIVKVERKKYKGGFIEKQGEVATTSTSSASSDDGGEVPAQVPTNPQSTPPPSSDATKTFFAQKTNSPDVYNLYDSTNNLVGVAGIQTLAISKKMRQLFANKNPVDKVELQCQFSDRLGKYVPIL